MAHQKKSKKYDIHKGYYIRGSSGSFIMFYLPFKNFLNILKKRVFNEDTYFKNDLEQPFFLTIQGVRPRQPLIIEE